MKFQLLNRIKNGVAKGEIAPHEQFQLLPQCFQKTSAADASKGSAIGYRLNNLTLQLTENMYTI